ncbi:hypothetical protein [Streptosporangium sp. NPDC051022]|uniref:hypothetical protein n=1 Tax=Streptosporangium sp. NPDC051022 TaxID=3155752 RepID=UPI00341EEF2E
MRRKAALLVTMLALVGACSGEGIEDPVVSDPASWPIAALPAIDMSFSEIHDLDIDKPGTSKAIARVRTGRSQVIAFTRTAGVCGVSADGVRATIDLTRSESTTQKLNPKVFTTLADDRLVSTTFQGGTLKRVTLACGPRTMLLMINTGSGAPPEDVRLDGEASAQVLTGQYRGQIAVVIANAADRRQVLPHATVQGVS